MQGAELRDGEAAAAAADDGNWYYAKIWLSDDGCLMLRGALDKLMILGRTQKWIRKK